MTLAPPDVFRKLSGNIEMVMRGQSGAIRKLLAAFASGGHVLLEDNPGTGKTTLAKAQNAMLTNWTTAESVLGIG